MHQTCALWGKRVRAGYTLLEITIVVMLFATVFSGSLALLTRDQSLSKSTVRISEVEHAATRMLYMLEREVANASGAKVARPSR